MWNEKTIRTMDPEVAKNFSFKEVQKTAWSEYYRVMEDMTYVDREQAASNAAVNSVTADVWKLFGVSTPLEASKIPEIRIFAEWILKDMGFEEEEEEEEEEVFDYEYFYGEEE